MYFFFCIGAAIATIKKKHILLQALQKVRERDCAAADARRWPTFPRSSKQAHAKGGENGKTTAEASGGLLGGGRGGEKKKRV